VATLFCWSLATPLRGAGRHGQNKSCAAPRTNKNPAQSPPSPHRDARDAGAACMRVGPAIFNRLGIPRGNGAVWSCRCRLLSRFLARRPLEDTAPLDDVAKASTTHHDRSTGELPPGGRRRRRDAWFWARYSHDRLWPPGFSRSHAHTASPPTHRPFRTRSHVGRGWANTVTPVVFVQYLKHNMVSQQVFTPTRSRVMCVSPVPTRLCVQAHAHVRR
jgi:hypothetical protein